MRVFATRPSKQNQSWCYRLECLQVDVQALPLLEVVPVATPLEKQTIKNHILELDQYLAVIFVSQNAVEWGMEWLDQYWPQLPSGVKWFAIGAKTAECLQQHPLMVSESVLAPLSTMNSEALLAHDMLQVQEITGQKILIFRGVGGRPYLADTLISRGAKVEYCELYHRTLPQKSRLLSREITLNNRDDILPVFSGESLQNFCELFADRKDSWAGIRVIVPGKRVAKIAQSQGFEKIILAENASETSMLDALQKAMQTKE